MLALQPNDAELVAESLKGNQDAFRQIVERYQALLCSIAYCATGSLSQSEDLAQETFVSAWRDLAELREPEKLRGWLCSILRFRVSKQFRQLDREPVQSGESLEHLAASIAPEAPPSDQAITNEEKALLWRALQQVPETYREPLVLFYREHQSVEAVAQTLELSEDAVKQRLSRGRKMLQERLLAFVENTLERTGPGSTFTLAVLAALPAMTLSAKAATLGTAAKAGAAVKGAGLFGLAGALLTPLLALAGTWVDLRLKKNTGHSEAELKAFRNWYIVIAISVGVEVVVTCLLMAYGRAIIQASPTLFVVLMIGLVAGFPTVVAALGRRRFIGTARQLTEAQSPIEIPAKLKSPFWEYRSQLQWFGLPLVHIRFGGYFGGRINQQWKPKPIKAWIAITDGSAMGVLFAYGGFAVAPVSMGAVAVGGISFAGFATGVLAVGGFGFGVWALAPFAFGWDAFGAGCAFAWNAASSGMYAVAHHVAAGTVAQAAQANNGFAHQWFKSNPFFQFWTAHMTTARMISIIWIWMVPIMISQLMQGWIMARRRGLKLRSQPE